MQTSVKQGNSGPQSASRQSARLGCVPVERLPHLRAWRERQSYGLRELAREAGLNQGTLYRLELLGTPAQPRTVRTLARVLGITVQQLRQALPSDNEVGPRT